MECNGAMSISGNPEPFSSRTFTRSKKNLLNFSPDKCPSPVGAKSGNLNSTFTRLNDTFDLIDSDTGLNSTFTKNDKHGLNTTFEMGKDRASNPSDVKLNNVGDVKVLADLQEQRLKQTTALSGSRSSKLKFDLTQRMANPSTSFSFSTSATATLSPTSVDSNTNSPSQSEDPPQFQEYSSQDSLPDSPYSSQSLEAPPLQNPGKCRTRTVDKEYHYTLDWTRPKDFITVLNSAWLLEL